MTSIKTKIMLLFALILSQATYSSAVSSESNRHALLLKEMFQKVTIEKNAAMIPIYYRKDFILYSNGRKMSYDEFFNLHKKIYKTPIQYKIRYDEKTWTEQNDNIAIRAYITTITPGESPHEIEVILIAQYRNNKLYKLWELTYPDWSKLKSFKSTNQQARSKL